MILDFVTDDNSRIIAPIASIIRIEEIGGACTVTFADGHQVMTGATLEALKIEIESKGFQVFNWR